MHYKKRYNIIVGGQQVKQEMTNIYHDRHG